MRLRSSVGGRGIEQRCGVECRRRRVYSRGMAEGSAPFDGLGGSRRSAASEEEMGEGEKTILYYGDF